MKSYTLALSTFCRNEDTIYINSCTGCGYNSLRPKILYTGIVYFLQMKISFYPDLSSTVQAFHAYIYKLGRILSSTHLDDKHMVVVTNQNDILTVLLSVKPTT